METKNGIIKALEEMQNFFDQHNVIGWTKRTQLAIQRINEGRLNTKTILEDFVGVGMGSLSDLYICADNGHQLKLSEDDTNQQLEKLAEQILIFKSGLDKR